MGRPSKLTPTITRAILDVVAAGGTRAVAAEAAGISESTLYKWLRRGAEDATTILNGGPGPSGQRPASTPGLSTRRKSLHAARLR